MEFRYLDSEREAIREEERRKAELKKRFKLNYLSSKRLRDFANFSELAVKIQRTRAERADKAYERANQDYAQLYQAYRDLARQSGTDATAGLLALSEVHQAIESAYFSCKYQGKIRKRPESEKLSLIKEKNRDKRRDLI